MKKSLLTIAMMSVLWSCNKKEDFYQSGVPTPQNNIADSGGDGLYDVLGFGYDVTLEYVSPRSSKLPVINIAKLKADHPTFVDISGAEETKFTGASGQNAEDFLQDLTIKTNISYGTGSGPNAGGTGTTGTGTGVDNSGKTVSMFSGSLEASFTNSDKYSSKYLYATYNKLILKKIVKVLPDASLLRNYLDAGFASRIQSASVEDIVRDYGTHVLVDISLGGEASVIYQAESTSSDRKSAAEAGARFAYGKVIAGANTTYSEQLKRTNNNESIVIRTIGGNSSAGIAPTTVRFSPDGTPTGGTYNIDAWGDGVTDTNAQLIRINEQGAIPLDELVTDPTKKAALKNYITNYLLSRRIFLSYESSNVYKALPYYDFGDYSEGGGVATGNFNGNNLPDAAFMVYRVNSNNEIRYRIAYDMSYGNFSSESAIKSTPGFGGASEGAGVAIADIDKNGQDDLIVMGYEALNGPNEFRYKIGYNIDSQGNPTYWSGIKKVPGIADGARSAGISFADINRNGTLDLILMAYDIPSGSQQIRYKVFYDISSSTGDVNIYNSSSTQFASGMADEVNGAAITMTDINNNGIPDLVVSVEDNPGGANEYRYKIGYDINQSGIPNRWSSMQRKTACGDFSDGSGIAFGNFDGNPRKDAIFMSIDAPNGPNQIRYKVGFNIDEYGAIYSWL